MEHETAILLPNGVETPPMTRHTWPSYRAIPQFRVECCPEDGYEDFCAEVRNNLTNAERDRFEEGHEAILAYDKVWKETPVEDRDDRDTPKRRELALIAPFVRAWNVQGVDAVSGELKPVPPPAEGGVDVFDLVEYPASEWLRHTVLSGFLSGLGCAAVSRRLRRLRATSTAGKTGEAS
jgi:hypothetical protein